LAQVQNFLQVYEFPKKFDGEALINGLADVDLVWAGYVKEVQIRLRDHGCKTLKTVMKVELIAEKRTFKYNFFSMD
jgi:hypothetical protein